MKSTTTISFLAVLALTSARPTALQRREVPQEHSHEKFITSVRTSLNINNPDQIGDPVFGLLGNAAAANGAGKITNLDCLHQATADRAFTNAKAAGNVQGQADALLYAALERNTQKVGQASVLCTDAAVNPEIQAISQHQDPAGNGAAATNKAITLELAKQLDSIGADPQLALQAGTFAPGDLNDASGKGNTCDTLDDAEGCIFTQNLLVEDATAQEIDAAVAGGNGGNNAGNGAANNNAGNGAANNNAGNGAANNNAGNGAANNNAGNGTADNNAGNDAADNNAGNDAANNNAGNGNGNNNGGNGNGNKKAGKKNGNKASSKASSKKGGNKDDDKDDNKDAGNNNDNNNAGNDAANNDAANNNAGNNVAVGQDGGACPAVSTVTVTAPAATAAPAATDAAAAAPVATDAPTATTGNVQAFTGTLGGAPPPVVSSAGDRPFSVNGATFVNLNAALQRSCAVQNNACANAVNSGALNVAGGVGACKTQEDDCNAA